MAVWSELAQRAIAAGADGGLLWLDGQGQLQRRLDSAPVQRLALFDEGRHALAVQAGQALALDVATGRVLQTLALAAPVSDIAFTDGFAYLHSPGAAQATLLSLADLRRGAARPVLVAVGARAAGDLPRLAAAGGAHRLQRLPDGSGMYVASPHDGEIYQYAEGMMAPIGNFSNYRRSPLALLVLDDGLQSQGQSQGRYRAVLRLPKGGNFELVLSGVQPRFADCQRVQVPVPAQPPVEPEATLAGLQAQLLATASAPGGLLVRARLVERAGGAPVAGVPDLVLLAFDRHSGWQARRTMRPSADGSYEALIETGATPDAAAQLDLRVSSISRDLPFHQGALVKTAGAAP